MFFFCRFVDKVGCPSLYNEYVEKNLERDEPLFKQRDNTISTLFAFLRQWAFNIC